MGKTKSASQISGGTDPAGLGGERREPVAAPAGRLRADATDEEDLREEDVPSPPLCPARKRWPPQIRLATVEKLGGGSNCGGSARRRRIGIWSL